MMMQLKTSFYVSGIIKLRNTNLLTERSGVENYFDRAASSHSVSHDMACDRQLVTQEPLSCLIIHQ